MKQMDRAVDAWLAAGAPRPGIELLAFPQQVQRGFRAGKKGYWLQGGGLRDLNCSEIHRHFCGDKL